MWCGSKIVSALEADVSAENDDNLNGVVIAPLKTHTCNHHFVSSRRGKYKVPLYQYWMLMENSIFTCNPFLYLLYSSWSVPQILRHPSSMRHRHHHPHIQVIISASSKHRKVITILAVARLKREDERSGSCP